MQSLSHAITHCQFDVSDSTQSEVVLLMILNLMEDMLAGPGGHLLSDESVCDMMGRGLTICSASRFSEVLRQTAEASMVRMCQIIFEDLKHLEEEAGDDADALDKKTNGDMDNVKMDTTINGTGLPLAPDAAGEPRLSSSSDKPRSSSDSAPESTEDAAAEKAEKAAIIPAEPTEKPDGPADKPATDEGEKVEADSEARKSTSTSSSGEESAESIDLRPYSLPSVRELFRVLVDFLDPNQKKHPDAMRVMALRIIHVALEVAGPSIARGPRTRPGDAGAPTAGTALPLSPCGDPSKP